jgi:SAM-dependent methyltransferase
VDDKTLAAYDRAPADYARDWHDQPAPGDLHQLVRRWFGPGRAADIGCGAGRDTAWLQANGWDAVGYDVSEGLLAEARRRHPGIEFREGGLPDLAGAEEYDNVLCETVIMHLPVAEIPPAVRRLVTVLRPGGTLYLSWRVTAGEDARDGAGRLYSAFASDLVLDALGAARLLHDSEGTSASSGRTVHRLVARRPVG